jgi:hypothetical protein
MVARNQTRDKSLEQIIANPTSAVAALRPPFRQGTFDFNLLGRKKQSLPTTHTKLPQ